MDLVVQNVDKRKLWIGIALMLAGMLMPLATNVYNFTIYDSLFLAMREREKIHVLIAAFKLVALSALRSLPHYLGAFCLGEALELRYRGRRLQIVRAVVVCALIPLIYALIDSLYHIHYDFGGPALLLIAMLIMLENAGLNMVNFSKKVLMVILLITAVQFLDVMPALDSLPFGRGETSMDIKNTARLLETDSYLQYFAVLLFALMLLSAILLCKLIRDENNLRVLGELKEQNERMRSMQQMQAMEERTQRELRHLVHDLKTPLTTAQALVGVVKFGCEQRPEGGKDAEYLTKVEASLEHMSAMVSEILYEDHQSVIETERIVTALLAQISNTAYAPLVRSENTAPGACVQINEIRFLRALVNLIENAFYALPDGVGTVWLRVSRAPEQQGVQFQVEDNGKGICQEQAGEIWKQGFSTRGSHGLGLQFVRQVVEANQGEIHMKSGVGEGTAMTIFLPEFHM